MFRDHAKKALIASAFLLPVIAGGTIANAMPAYDTLWTYYSDASETEIIGTKELTCGGNLIVGGDTSSPYYEMQLRYPCVNN